MAAVPTECPACHMKDFQRVGMARAAGTTTANTTGVAVGMSGRGDLGVGSYNAVTHTQTELASRLNNANLRNKRNNSLVYAGIFGIGGTLLFLMFIGVEAQDGRLSPQAMATFFLLVGIAGAVGFGITTPSMEAVEASEALDSQLNRSWVCLRCGNVWEPQG